MTREEFVAKFEGTAVKAAGILKAQDIARAEMESLKKYLRPGLTREEIHAFAEQDMLSMGSEGWWIHNDPALVLFGALTTYSAREDAGSRFDGKVVQENDIVTVDVAPTVDGGWGDLCRAFFLQDGVVTDWQQLRNDHWREGMEFEQQLHREAVAFVDEHTTFHQLHAHIDAILKARGWHNCDYHGNFGHTIENDQKDRVTIVAGEHRCIAAYGKPITFEPHICKDGEQTGFKHEIMYVFHEGKLVEVP